MDRLSDQSRNGNVVDAEATDSESREGGPETSAGSVEEQFPVEPLEWTTVRLSPSESEFVNRLRNLRENLQQLIKEMEE